MAGVGLRTSLMSATCAPALCRGSVTPQMHRVFSQRVTGCVLYATRVMLGSYAAQMWGKPSGAICLRLVSPVHSLLGCGVGAFSLVLHDANVCTSAPKLEH